MKIHDLVIVEDKYFCEVVNIVEEDGKVFYECLPMWDDNLPTRFIDENRIRQCFINLRRFTWKK